MPQIASPLIRGERYSFTHWNDRFIVLTNTGNAIDFQFMQTPDTAPSRENWTPFVPHEPGRFLLGATACKTHLAWSERVNGNIEIHVTQHDAQGDIRDGAKTIGMKEEAFDLTLLGFLEYGDTTLRYIYESPTTPAHWYDVDMASGAQTLQKIRDVPSGHDPALYETHRLFARAQDGAEIPVTVLKRRDTPCMARHRCCFTAMALMASRWNPGSAPRFSVWSIVAGSMLSPISVAVRKKDGTGSCKGVASTSPTASPISSPAGATSPRMAMERKGASSPMADRLADC